MAAVPLGDPAIAVRAAAVPLGASAIVVRTAADLLADPAIAVRAAADPLGDPAIAVRTAADLLADPAIAVRAAADPLGDPAIAVRTAADPLGASAIVVRTAADLLADPAIAVRAAAVPLGASAIVVRTAADLLADPAIAVRAAAVPLADPAIAVRAAAVPLGASAIVVRTAADLLADPAIAVRAAAVPLGASAIVVRTAADLLADPAIAVRAAAVPLADPAIAVRTAAVPLGASAFAVRAAAVPLGDRPITVRTAADPLGERSGRGEHVVERRGIEDALAPAFELLGARAGDSPGRRFRQHAEALRELAQQELALAFRDALLDARFDALFEGALFQQLIEGQHGLLDVLAHQTSHEVHEGFARGVTVDLPSILQQPGQPEAAALAGVQDTEVLRVIVQKRDHGPGPAVLHDAQGQARHWRQGAGVDLADLDHAQIFEHVPQREQMRSQVAPGLVREIRQLEQRGGRGPWPRALVEEHGQHGGQTSGGRVPLAPVVQEVEGHLGHAPAHPVLDRALMLEQQPHERLAFIDQSSSE
jgi:hypothetical protein